MSEETNRKTMLPATLCWSCSKAIGGCNWSKSFKAVKGWRIIPTQKTAYGGVGYKSCVVLECPEFVRDAYKDGLKRVGGDKFYDTMSKNT